MKTTIQSILANRHYLLSTYSELDKSKVAYYNAYLLSNCGVIVDKPQLLTKDGMEVISDIFKLNVPASFYANPQHMAYFTKTELLIEQLVSYFLVETGTGIYSRPEIFEKDLPEYKVGDEITLREFKIVTEDEAVEVLQGIADAYCDYTRPFALDELAEFEFLFANGYYTEGKEIKCRDNIFTLLGKDITFARFLDKKDMVKLSVAKYGDRKTFSPEDRETLDLIARCLPYVRNCPMSKKQAKYFNKLATMCNAKVVKANNSRSPYKLANAELAKGNVLGAAEIYARNGSLLERNIKFLLSRANPVEAVKILEMLPAKNPMALYQMVSTLSEDSIDNRTFTFTKNNKVKKHTETEYEARWRKSRLNDATKKLLHDAALEKVINAYEAMDKLGKVYVSDSFDKLGIPTNTSAGGKGIDMLSTGSRVAIPYNNIRTFVYWKDVYDIDASLTLVKADGKLDCIYFGNYSTKPYGTSILFSGDNRSNNGAEYYDIKLDELRAKGYVAVLYTLTSYNGRFDQGEVFCGYQNKDNLLTAAWDPKNIAMQFKVPGVASRVAATFGIDLTTNEMIVLNIALDSNDRVVKLSDYEIVKKYMDSNFLELNVGLVARARGEVVTDPAEADVVFDDAYVPTENQKVVRTYELEKLVALANGGSLK